MVRTLEAHIRIGGVVLPGNGLDRVPHVNPATGKPQGSVPVAGPAEVDQAVTAARAAFPSWRVFPANQRRDLLLRIADEMEADTAELARLAILENGTPKFVSAMLASGIAVDYFRYYAGWADKLTGDLARSVGPDENLLDYSLPEPYGVVAVLTAFNAPMTFVGMKVAAALAAGNTVVLKPSELAPFTTDRFGQICQRAGLPEGVLNIVQGDGRTGAELVGHPGIDKITFTGSGANARKILAAAAPNLTPAALELGGKSAGMIFQDANIEAAVTECIYRGIAAQAGQSCLAPTRLVVQTDVYERAIETAAAVAQSIIVGDPQLDSTQVGPVISALHRDRILGLIDNATADGGRLAGGGQPIHPDLSDGFFIQPAIIADVKPDSYLAQNEVFGPVLSIIPFEDEDEGVRISNGTPFGLAAYVFTGSVSRAHRVAGSLDAGFVSVNTVSFPRPGVPFGGNKQSGMGREGGREGLAEMLRVKNVVVQLAEG